MTLKFLRIFKPWQGLLGFDLVFITVLFVFLIPSALAQTTPPPTTVATPTVGTTPVTITPEAGITSTPGSSGETANDVIKGLNTKGYFISQAARTGVSEPDLEKNINNAITTTSNASYAVRVVLLDAPLLMKLEPKANGNASDYARSIYSSVTATSTLKIVIVVDTNRKQVGLSSLLIDFYKYEVINTINDSLPTFSSAGYAAGVKTLAEKVIQRDKDRAEEVKQQKAVEESDQATLLVWVVIIAIIVVVIIAVVAKASLWDVLGVVLASLSSSE